MSWRKHLRHDPLVSLQKSESNAIQFLVKRDILDSTDQSAENLWLLPEPQKLIKRQLPNGSWKYPGKSVGDRIGTNYFLLETFRSLRILVDKYEFDQGYACLRRAVEYFFSCQTKEGDIRGILVNQYMPYYMGAILALVIKAGYGEDPRTIQGLDWLLSMRQEDGGWIIPLQAYKINYLNEVAQKPPIPPDRSLPFSHLATGMVLRAFAVHPKYQRRAEIIHAGELLKSRFLKNDVYSNHGGIKYWTRFQYPYWWTDLLSSMDLLQRIGFISGDADIERGLEWFIHFQGEDGLWKASYEKRPDADLWVSLAVCRILKKFLD